METVEKEEKSIGDIVGRAVTALLKQNQESIGGNKPFFAHLLLQFKRIYTEEIPTCGVSITDQVNLYINPKFFASLSVQEQIAVLCHEIYHIINYHPTRGQGKDHKIFNLAADMAINHFISNLPCLRDKEGKQVVMLNGVINLDGKEYTQKQFPNAREGCPIETGIRAEHFGFKGGEATEYYYNMLMKKREELQEMLEDFDNGEGNGEDGKDKNGKSSKDKMMGGGSFLDDHRKWGEGQGATDKEYVKEKVKQMIKDTYEKCKDFGSVPSSVVAQIAKIANESLINWKSELRKFSMFATKYASRESWRRRSRRFDKMKGRVIDPTLKVAVLVDTSGSMGEDDLAQISKELMVLYQSTKDIYVIECDAAVGKEYKFKGKIVKTWTGRGGTSFQPALDAAKKYKPDIIIYLTDGYPCDRPMKPKVPILWVITPSGVNDRSFVSFGKMVKMKNTDNNRMGR